MATSAFPTYLDMRSRVPVAVWHVARVISVASLVSLCAVLVVAPSTGLRIFWRGLVPLLPLLWFLAPGLWRNVCPLGAANQAPRWLGFTRARRTPDWFRRHAYAIGVVAFLLIVPTRRVALNRNGPAVAALLLGVLLLAFLGGVVFKGKSGWCSTVCPLLPVQRLYGETPFLLVRNSHCPTCVGCAKNCFDFNPRAAKLADLHDDDARYRGYRRFFAGAFPGFILAFYSLTDGAGWATAYGRFALYLAVSLGSFFVLDTFVPLTAHRATALYAAAALNIFYWYNTDLLLGGSLPWMVWPARAAILGLSLMWLARTVAKERLFLPESADMPVVVRSTAVIDELRGQRAEHPSVVFEPGGRDVVARVRATLLEVAESASLSIEAGCRMGVCGADPVAVLEGADNLSAVGEDERRTLDRLGYAPNTRMACSARVQGPCRVALEPEPATAATTPAAPPFHVDPEVRRLVVIGNGIAGATVVDHARRLHPDCEIHLVGSEPHRLYNRMGISRVIYGRSAMHGLHLLPDTWYDDHAITCWLNTRARRINRDSRTVDLATGEQLEYDRLVLTMGSRAAVPPIASYGLPGTFTLRDADDAIAIRAYAQQHDVTDAVVAGGGLLGLEAAYALHKLGLRVTVLERGPWLLRRQLDQSGGQMLERYLVGLGLEIETRTETVAVHGDGRLEAVEVTDGQRIPAGIFLVAAGIEPMVELAQGADLEVARGVLVDDSMRTSDPCILAAGDVAEHRGVVSGLWISATHQAEVAAVNAVGGERSYEPPVPVTILKVVGVELLSIGRVDAVAGDEEIAFEDANESRYRKLVIADGKIAGAILLGHPDDAPVVQEAAPAGRPVDDVLDRLRAGDWASLAEPVAAAAPAR